MPCHNKHTLPTTQDMILHMEITRWSTPKSDWLCSLQLKMEELYTVSKNKTWSWLWLRSWTLIAKFSLKLKKVGKITKLLRYDLNQIPYTVEITNRFKGDDLVYRVPEDLWMEVCNIVQEMVTKILPKKKKCNKAKWLSEEALQTSPKRRELKTKEKGKDISN